MGFFFLATNLYLSYSRRRFILAEKKMEIKTKGCMLCPRECNADRTHGENGICGVSGEGILGARAALHMWEEPCISGETGSGTVFFSGCPLRCVYCQNYFLAHAKQGELITVERLADIFLDEFGIFSDEFNVQHGFYSPSSGIRRAMSSFRSSVL